MSLVLQSPDAEEDLIEIWSYIMERGGQIKADQVIDKICEVCVLLADHPLMGRTRDELAENLRSFPVKDYTLFYRPISNGIELLHVVHHSRDLRRLYPT